jgi:hypothetical protein
VPGRTPTEASEAFFEPLRSALACITRGKITPSRGGRSDPHRDHSWTLNKGSASLTGGYTFTAGMIYKIIEDPEKGPWRVTTLAYEHELVDANNRRMFALHWHPQGVSTVTTPHLHLGPGVLVDGCALTPKAHLPMPRATFEQAIRWVVEVIGSPLCDDWADRLKAAEDPHLEHRTWHY